MCDITLRGDLNAMTRGGTDLESYVVVDSTDGRTICLNPGSHSHRGLDHMLLSMSISEPIHRR